MICKMNTIQNIKLGQYLIIKKMEQMFQQIMEKMMMKKEKQNPQVK